MVVVPATLRKAEVEGLPGVQEFKVNWVTASPLSEKKMQITEPSWVLQNQRCGVGCIKASNINAYLGSAIYIKSLRTLTQLLLFDVGWI